MIYTYKLHTFYTRTPSSWSCLGWSSCTLLPNQPRLGVPFVFFGLQVGRGRICGQQQQPLTYPNYAKIFASYLYLTLDPHPPIEGDTKTRMRLVSNFPPFVCTLGQISRHFPLSTPSPLSPSPSRPPALPLSPSRPPPFALPLPPCPLAPLPPSFHHLGPFRPISTAFRHLGRHYSGRQTEAPPPHYVTTIVARLAT